MEHLMRIEYTESYPSIHFPMIALFDDRKISAKEVEDLLQAGENSPFVIVCTREQFQNVFASLINKEDEDG